MKKVILAAVIGISAMSFVSCGNTEVNEDNIKNKYNVDEYVEKGATVEKYLPSGSVVMKDSKGTKFYLGKDSSYKVALNDEGIILPYVDVNDNVYYFDSSVKALPEGFERSGRISSYGGSENLVKSDDLGVEYILCQGFEEDGVGLAIMNRLNKAAGYDIIKV